MQDAQSLFEQANALQQAGRRKEAINVYQKLLALRPDLADSWYNLGFLLKTEGKYEAALEAYETALARGIREPEEVHLNRAVIYTDHLRKDDLAEAELNAALRFKSNYFPALLNLGNLNEERGEREKAAACYEKITKFPPAVGAAPDRRAIHCEALARLVHLHPPTGPNDPLLRDLMETSRGAAGLEPMTRANLFYALARAHDSIAQYDDAFTALTEANQAARQTGPAYDRAKTEREFDALIDAFNSDAGPPVEAAATAPIFICGMFRSGSTLVEQVLAAHSKITAGGELNILHRLARTTLAPFPSSMGAIAEDRISSLAGDYRSEIAKLFPDAVKAGHSITDKRPDNFLLIGLIMRLFPNAKIVHTVRQPLDNSLSVYFQHLDQQNAGYASDLGNIAHYFGQYRRLMAHWKRHYPSSIFDFDYDKFVAEPKPTLEALLNFLEIDWDEACLEFYKVKNTVKTASYWQVRKPLYTASSGRWRNYEAHLQPLRSALKKSGVEETE